jgi:hypothetical protein
MNYPVTVIACLALSSCSRSARKISSHEASENAGVAVTSPSTASRGTLFTSSSIALNTEGRDIDEREAVEKFLDASKRRTGKDLKVVRSWRIDQGWMVIGYIPGKVAEGPHEHEMRVGEPLSAEVNWRGDVKFLGD